MATSEVTICNLALFRVGHTQRIDALTEASVSAELCKIIYPLTRDMVLEDHDWNFARKRVALADVGSPPTNWEYQYQYPSDCLKVRGVVIEGTRTPTAANRVAYEVTNNTVNEGLAICTDLAEAEIIYTAYITSARMFTPGFVNALAWRMAFELVSPLARDPKFATLAAQQYPVALANAIAQDLNERQGDYPTSEFINERA